MASDPTQDRLSCGAALDDVKDVSDVARGALTNAVREVTKNIGTDTLTHAISEVSKSVRRVGKASRRPCRSRASAARQRASASQRLRRSSSSGPVRRRRDASRARAHNRAPAREGDQAAAGRAQSAPDERIKWRVEQGISHTGVVTFHELGPRLTRVELTVDIDPGSLIEKLARGARHIKRAMRADMHRFKAFIEMQEVESGAWRGVIEDGELVEDHDRGYDDERDSGDGGRARRADETAEDNEVEEEVPEAVEDEAEAEDEPVEEESRETRGRPRGQRPRARAASGDRSRGSRFGRRRSSGRGAASRSSSPRS